MKEITLIEPDIAYEKTFLDFINSFWNINDISWFWISSEKFNWIIWYLQHIKEQKMSINIWQKVPTSTFWLMKWNTMIWTINIRHYLNEKLLRRWWNIWYSIHPYYRNLWFWKEILRLWIIEVRKLGIKDILVTCDEDNIWSRKVIESNGWILENIVDLWRRYWIK
jgi:predicted acetyltransferase